MSKQHEVYLFALNTGKIEINSIEQLKPYCKEIKIIKHPFWRIILNLFWSIFGNKPFQVSYFINPKANEELKDWIQQIKPDHVYCQLIRTVPLIEEIPDIPKTLDYQDAFAKSMERMKQNVAFWLKPLYSIESKRLRRYEHLAFHFFKNHSIISLQDRDYISHARNKEIKVIPNGVDLLRFQYKFPENRAFHLLFHGNMAYFPNVDCVTYIVKEIIPVLKEKGYPVKLIISGADPVERVLKLAGDSVLVTGRVENPVESYLKASILLAPMRLSTGLQNKLLEAMACGLPCVTSQLANQALNAIDDFEVLTASNTEDYALQIIRLLTDGDLYRKLSRNGRKFVEENYSWEANTEKLLQMF